MLPLTDVNTEVVPVVTVLELLVSGTRVIVPASLAGLALFCTSCKPPEMGAPKADCVPDWYRSWLGSTRLVEVAPGVPGDALPPEVTQLAGS